MFLEYTILQQFVWLQLMFRVILRPMMNDLYLYSSTFRSVCVCVQCTVWLFSVVTWCRAFRMCCSDIFLIILRFIIIIINSTATWKNHLNNRIVVIIIIIIIIRLIINTCRFRWPCGLRRKSAAAWFLGSLFRILMKARMLVSCVCCLLQRADHSFRGGLPDLCDLETWTARRFGL